MTGTGWGMSQHACANCGARILHRVDELTRSRGGIFRCSTCPAESVGSPAAICGCGIRPLSSGTRDGGFRCGKNPALSADAPAEIAILFG